ncbi:hypothetical protein HPB50_012655 [Hyalomma asiaticum]|uniref:Uncharacterized protein n=1 Tax=Hyalomma asiaticum TaxID=266040 RepID=A0ACB7RNB7_HYAAI|nr:hypothetical protein HPB50_012655 [Hyalomma asiaticum]
MRRARSEQEGEAYSERHDEDCSRVNADHKHRVGEMAVYQARQVAAAEYDESAAEGSAAEDDEAVCKLPVSGPASERGAAKPMAQFDKPCRVTSNVPVTESKGPPAHFCVSVSTEPVSTMSVSTAAKANEGVLHVEPGEPHRNKTPVDCTEHESAVALLESKPIAHFAPVRRMSTAAAGKNHEDPAAKSGSTAYEQPRPESIVALYPSRLGHPSVA